jgi:hypothetical protein
MAGKKYAEALQKVDRTKQYTVDEAVALIKDLAKRKFDESVDVAIALGVDPRKADQMVRGTVSLPHGTGKTVRVAVFAAGRLPRRRARRAPTSSARKTSPTGSRRRTSSTSTPQSQHRISCRSSGSSERFSARVA